MKRKTLLRVFAYFLAAFFSREAYLYYRVFSQVTHQAPSSLELSIQNGYPAEEHKVTTEDGYILTIFRIPDRKSNKPTTGPKPVVLLQHGMLSNSNSFVSIGPKSLGFLLADLGYDVWLGNIRGNRYALEHSTYNTSDPEFWDFSYDEPTLYDLPAIIDYILKFTNHKKLSYVGHSFGATVILGLISTSPEYNNKVDTIIAMAPGCPGGELSSPLAIMALDIFVPSILIIGPGALFPHVDEFINYSYSYCAPHLFFSFVCDLLYLMGGPSTHVNRANYPLITSSVSSTSRKFVAHIGSTLAKGRFHHWNSDSNNDYPLHLVSVPVTIFYSDGDYVVNSWNVQFMNKTLSNVASIIKVPDDSFNHLDFLFGETAGEFIYKEIFKTLEKCHGPAHVAENTTTIEKYPDKN